jgi:endonuclease/exonuclease/phosphatase family metal-dependent hydrolase
MESLNFWLENLRKHATLEDLRNSSFYARNGAQIESYLNTPQVFPDSNSVPRLRTFLRVAQWNIEKGKRFKPILHRLQSDEILKWADVIILNEADMGMVRSGNRFVARDLAEALEMHMVFGPAHFELTKGIDEELLLEGENRESQQGNAILSRYPISETEIVPLPVSFEPYEFHEKRFGRRNCLWARLQVNGSPVWVGSVHLELRNTPRSRAEQVAAIMAHLPGSGREKYILGGDLNTNGFSRGTAWRSIHSALRILFRSPEQVQRELLHPELKREPLFRIASRSGFDWEPMNTNEETGRAAIGSLEEAAILSRPVSYLTRKQLAPYQGYLRFKLDWLFGKNIRALGDGQKQDDETGVISIKPAAVKEINFGPDRVSDHLPIYADYDLE